MLEDLQRKGKRDAAKNLKFSKEQIGLSKAEAKAELRWLIEESSGSLFTKGKPYSKWMERVPFPTKYKRLDIAVFKGNGPAKQHLWLFTMQTSRLLKNDSQLVMPFASTLKGLAFDWFEGLPEWSIQTFHDLKITFERNLQEEIHRVTGKTLLEICQKDEESAKDYVE